MPKDIKFTNYEDSVDDIFTADADKNGNNNEKIAWYARALYDGSNGNIETIMKDENVGIKMESIIAIAGADTGTKRINFSSAIKLQVIGVTLTLTPSAGGSAIVISPTSGRVSVSPVVGSGYYTLTYSGSSGIIYANNPLLVDYIYTTDAGTSVVMDINIFLLRYLLVTNTTSITGSVTNHPLTYLYLSNTHGSIIGDISGKEIATLRLVNVTLLEGSIDEMPLTTIYCSAAPKIDGSITGMPLSTVYLNDVYIAGLITGRTLAYLYLKDMADRISYGTNTFNVTGTFAIQLVGTTVFTASEYRQLMLDAAAGTWAAGSKPFTITGGDSPGYDDEETPPQLKTAYDTLVAKGNVVITLPSAWKGGAYPNDFPA